MRTAASLLILAGSLLGCGESFVSGSGGDGTSTNAAGGAPGTTSTSASGSSGSAGGGAPSAGGAGGSMPSAPPNCQTTTQLPLVDDFEDGVPEPLWSHYDPGASVGESGGVAFSDMAINQNDFYSGFWLDDGVIVDECAITVEVLQVTSGTVEGDSYFQLSDSAGRHAGFALFYGNIEARHREFGTNLVGQAEPYDSTAHRYLRIRETGGRTYHETSPDGVSWSTLVDHDTPDFLASAVYLSTGTCAWSALSAGGTFRFDNLGILP